LARNHSVSSDMMASATNSLNLSGKIKINEATIEISATDTLNAIADKINSADGVGVTASVIQMGTDQYKLTLTSKETGLEHEIQMSDLEGSIMSTAGPLGLGLLNGTDPNHQDQTAADAVIKVNGLEISRSSNSIDDVITGVTLDLTKTTTAGNSIRLNIESDLDSIVTAAKTFVDQYNSTMTFIGDNLAYDDKTKTKGTLFADSSLIQIQSQLRRFLSRTVSNVDPSVNQLSLVGISTGEVGSHIEVTKAGNLVLDSSKLRKKLETNFEDVAKLFGASVSNMASAKNGATISGSSPSIGAGYPVTSLIDGRTSSVDWGQGGGYSADGALPQYVDISFAQSTTINTINLYTLNSDAYSAVLYGIKDYKLQYSNSDSGEDWTDIGTYTDNTKGYISQDFSAVLARRIRVEVTAVNSEAAGHANLIEVEAYEQNNGIFSNMYSSLNELTKSGGATSTKIESFNDEISDIDDRIEVLQKRLDDQEAAYYAKFTALETAMSKLQTQSNWMSSQMANLTKSSNNN
jgi:flagellar hook-associated protein 2